jgi:hypothetical protein
VWQTSLLGLHFMQQQGDALLSKVRQKYPASSIITTIPFFGLAYDNIKILNKLKSKWSPKNQTKQRNNKKFIKNLS